MPLYLKIDNPIDSTKASRQTGIAGSSFVVSPSSGGAPLTNEEQKRPTGADVKSSKGLKKQVLARGKRLVMNTQATTDAEIKSSLRQQGGVEITLGDVNSSFVPELVGLGQIHPTYNTGVVADQQKVGLRTGTQPILPNHQFNAGADESIRSQWAAAFWYPFPVPDNHIGHAGVTTPDGQIPLVTPLFWLWRYFQYAPGQSAIQSWQARWIGNITASGLGSHLGLTGYQSSQGSATSAPSIQALFDDPTLYGRSAGPLRSGGPNEFVQASGTGHWCPNASRTTNSGMRVIEFDAYWPIFAFIGTNQFAFFVPHTSNYVPYPYEVEKSYEQDWGGSSGIQYVDPRRHRVCGVPWVEDGQFLVRLETASGVVFFQLGLSRVGVSL